MNSARPGSPCHNGAPMEAPDSTSTRPTTAPAGATDGRSSDSVWARYRPDADSPWDLRRVVHLHRRAAFGATWREIQRDLKEGPQSAVGRILDAEDTREGVPHD